MVDTTPTITQLLLWVIKFPKIYGTNGTIGVVAGLGAAYALFGNPMIAFEAADYAELAKGYAVGGAVAYGVATSLDKSE